MSVFYQHPWCSEEHALSRRLGIRLSEQQDSSDLDEDQKVLYLLHYIGSTAFDVICNRLVSADSYSKLSVHCNFEAYLNTGLKNQLVFGLASLRIQSRLLEMRKLTFEKAIQIATAMELSEDTQQLQLDISSTLMIGTIDRRRNRNKKRSLLQNSLKEKANLSIVLMPTTILAFKVIKRSCFLSRWVTPIVPVFKEDNRVYICGLANANIRINESKCEFFKDTIYYCGYKIKDGIHKTVEKCKQLTIQGYTFNVTSNIKTQNNNSNADCLSCLSMPLFPTTKHDVVHKNTQLIHMLIISAFIMKKKEQDSNKDFNLSCKDEAIQFIRDFTMLALNGMLATSSRSLYQTFYVEWFLKELHKINFGIAKMKALARTLFCWPGLDKSIENLTNSCSICNSYRNDPQIEPILANIVLQDLEQEIITTNNIVATFYFRYVDDIILFVHKDKVTYIKKPTNSGRYLNYYSNHLLVHKRGVIIGQLDRILFLSHPKFHKKNISDLINGYPLEFIFSTIKNRIKTLENQFRINLDKNSDWNNNEHDSNSNLRKKFFVIPVYNEVKTAYGDKGMNRTSVFKWCREFKNGRTSVHDDQRSGRPSILTDDIVEKIENALRDDRRLTVDELSAMFPQISRSLLHETITETLGYRKLSARWVPKQLTDQHKLNRVEAGQEFLRRYKLHGDEFLRSIVTGDETWVEKSFQPTRR
ncbi:SETMR methyltransferase, partial [Pseudoatta argentina]